MDDISGTPEHLLQNLADAVRRHLRAVERQVQRVRSATTPADDEVDSFFFCVALCCLRADVIAARNHCNRLRDGRRSSPLENAIEAFDAAVPDLRKVRDLQVHAEEYDTRSARRRHKEIDGPMPIWRAADDDTTVVHVAGYSLDVVDAAGAARALADTVQAVLRPSSASAGLDPIRDVT